MYARHLLTNWAFGDVSCLYYHFWLSEDGKALQHLSKRDSQACIREEVQASSANLPQKVVWAGIHVVYE
jgi:hypothetical protein